MANEYNTTVFGSGPLYGPILGSDLSVDRFLAHVPDYDVVELSWSAPTGNWDNFLLVRSTDGYPVHIDDGVQVYQSIPSQLLTKFTDTPLIPGKEYYYSIFLHSPGGFIQGDGYFQAATAHASCPAHMRGLETVVLALPRLVTSPDMDAVGAVDPDNQFRRFLSIFGFQVDKIRTDIARLLPFYDAMHLPGAFVPVLAKQFGIDPEVAVGLRQTRMLARDAAYIYQRKGSLASIAAFSKDVTGQGAIVQRGTNLVLDADDSSGKTSAGRWRQYGNASIARSTNSSYIYVPPSPSAPGIALPGGYVPEVGGTFQVTSLGASNTSVQLGGTLALGYGIPISGGATYAYSAYFKAATTGRTVQWQVQYFTADGVSLGAPVAATALGTTTADAAGLFTRIASSHTAPATAAFAAPVLLFVGCANNEVHYFDAVQVEQMTVPVLNPGFEENSLAPWTVTDPYGDVNLCKNGTFETNVAGWQSPFGFSVSTLAASTTQHHSGSKSLRVTLPTTTAAKKAGAAYTATDLIIGQRYDVSMWVYVPTGVSDFRIAEMFGGTTNVSYGQQANTDTNDAWIQLTMSVVPTSTTHYFGIYNVAPTTAGQVVYIDDVVIQNKTSPGALQPSLTTVDKNSGQQSLKLVGSVQRANAYVEQKVKVTPGTAYTVGAYAKVTSFDATGGTAINGTLATHRGVNCAGGEFGTVPGVYGTDYKYDSLASYQFLASRGHTVIRLPFLWERVQPTLGGALDTTAMGHLDQAIADIGTAGMVAILDMHNYGRYNGNALGDPTGPTQAQFVDVWTKLSTRYKTNDSVQGYGLQNEPHDLPGAFTSNGTLYDFEAGVGTWNVDGNPTGSSVTSSTAQKQAGTKSALAVTPVTAGFGKNIRVIDNAATVRNLTTTGAGPTLSAWVYVPSSNNAANVSAVLQIQDAAFSFVNGPNYNITPDTWTQIQFTPANTLYTSCRSICVQVNGDFTVDQNFTVYVDQIQVGASTTGAARWKTVSQAAVSAIRANSDTKTIYIAGYQWSGLQSWAANNGTTGWITDSTNNFYYEAHHYWDNSHAGVYSDTYATENTAAATGGFGTTNGDALTTRTLSELQAWVTWLTANSAKGFIGEFGWPTSAHAGATDSASWNTLADKYMSLMDTAKIPGTYWATGELWPADYETLAYGKTGSTLNTALDPAQVLEAHPPLYNTAVQTTMYRGVAASGGDFGVTPGVYGNDYTYNSTDTYAFLASRGHKLIRLPFLWERVQPTYGAALSSTELSRLDAAIAAIGAAGMKCLLSLHSHDLAVGASGGPTQANLNDVWSRLSTYYKNNSDVLAYCLYNEPHDWPTTTTTTGVTLYDFETTTSGWTVDKLPDGTNPPGASTAISTTFAKTGTHSLKVINTPQGLGYGWNARVVDNSALRNLTALGAGGTLTAWVYVPAQTGISNVTATLQLQDQQFVYAGGANFTVPTNTWTLVSYTPPSSTMTSARSICVQFNYWNTGGTTSFTAYIDAITAQGVTSGRASWQSASQSALNAVRATGDTKLIMVCGYFYSGVPGWVDNNGTTSWITDSANNFRYEAHHYWDRDHSGTYQDSYDDVVAAAADQGYGTTNGDALTTRTITELKVWTDWLTTNNVKGFIGEYGWPTAQHAGADDSVKWNALGDKFLSKLDSLGMWATYWSTGEFWPDTYEVVIYNSLGDGRPVTEVREQAVVVEAHPSSYAGSLTSTGLWVDDGSNNPVSTTFSGVTSGFVQQSVSYTPNSSALTIRLYGPKGVTYWDDVSVSTKTATYFQDARAVNVLLFSDRVNLCTNPGFEISAANWTRLPTTPSGYSGSTAISRSTIRSYAGTASLLVQHPTTAGKSGVATTLTDLTPGSVYTVSGYVFIPVGSPTVAIESDGVPYIPGRFTTNTTYASSANASQTGRDFSLTLDELVGIDEQTNPETINAWSRISYQFVATAPVHTVAFYAWNTTSTQSFFLDRVLVEDGEVLRDYFDGSFTTGQNYDWEGTAGLSRSHFTANKSVKSKRLYSALPQVVPMNVPYVVRMAWPGA